MKPKDAVKAFMGDKQIDFKSRHGDFKGLRISKLVYERVEGEVVVSFVLKSVFGNSEMSAALEDCNISEKV